MTTPRKSLLSAAVLTVLTLSPSFAPAQDAPTTKPAATRPAAVGAAAGRERADRAVAFVNRQIDAIKDATASLDLNATQKEKVDAILTQARKDVEAKAAAPEGRERFRGLQDVRQSVLSDLRAVLTDEQRSALEKKVQDMRPRGPAGERAPSQAGPGEMLQRLREAIANLDLTAEQREKFQEMQRTNEAKRQELMALDPAERAPKARELLESTRDRVSEILTPEQMEKVREAMQRPQNESAKPGRPERNAGKPSAKSKDARTDDKTMMAGESMDNGMMDAKASKSGKASRSDAPKTAEAPAPAGVAIGQPIPDLKLKRVDGRSVQLSSFKGKVLVLAFGSYTTPTFRDKAPALDDLAKEYASKASFLLIYTKESHPTGGWEVERNKQDDVRIPQHADEGARKLAAEKARSALRLSALPVALDTMDNAAADAFGTLPDGVVIIGKDGTVTARQKWLEPMSLKRLIDQAIKTPTTQP